MFLHSEPMSVLCCDSLPICRQLYDLNQTYDTAWRHTLQRSDLSLLCLCTSCIHMYGNLTLACTTQMALSAWCLDLPILSRWPTTIYYLVQTATLGLLALGLLYISSLVSATLVLPWCSLLWLISHWCDHRLFIGSKIADASFRQSVGACLLDRLPSKAQTDAWWLASFLLLYITYSHIQPAILSLHRHW